MENPTKFSKENVSLFVSGFITGFLVTFFSLFACLVFYGSTLADTNTRAPETTKAPATPRSPTRIPTRTPVVDKCYLKLVSTEGQYTATVYVVVRGKDALFFCDYMAEDDSIVEISVVSSIPNFPVWCKQSVESIEGYVTLEVVSEYQIFGEAACEGLGSPTSFGG